MTSIDAGKAVRLTATKPVRKSLQERIEALSHRVEYRRMVDFEDRVAVYNLYKEAYKRHTKQDAWDALSVAPADEPNAVTVGLFIDRELVGSFKVTIVTKTNMAESQSYQHFPDAVEPLLTEGKVFIDPGRFSSTTEAAKRFPELPFLLMRIPVMACQYFDADECFSLIRQEHSAFYKRAFHAERIVGPVWYDPLQIDLVLMTSHVRDIRENVFDRFPFWKASYLEMRQMFGAREDIPALAERLKKAA